MPTDLEPVIPSPDDFYTAAQREVQEQGQTTQLANAVVQAVVRDELEPQIIDFVMSRDFFFLSTVNARGEPTVSYKGGRIGVAHVVDAQTIVFPSYNGNGMYLSAGNIADTGNVGMLFIDFATPNRVRVQGAAKLTKNDKYMQLFPGAEFIVKVKVTSVFVNCARYIHKHKRVEETNRYVPNDRGEQPFPAWKRIDAIQPALHPDDLGKADNHGGTITEEEYKQKLMSGTS